MSYLAASLYQTYCAAVGGFAYNGDPLPSWDEFAADPGKQKQADAWRAVAARAMDDEAISRALLYAAKFQINEDLTDAEIQQGETFKAMSERVRAAQREITAFGWTLCAKTHGYMFEVFAFKVTNDGFPKRFLTYRYVTEMERMRGDDSAVVRAIENVLRDAVVGGKQAPMGESEPLAASL